MPMCVALVGPRLWASSAACVLFCSSFSVYGCTGLLETNGFISLHSKHEVVNDLPMLKKRYTELNMSRLLDAIPDAIPKVSHTLLSLSELIGYR